MKTLTMTARIAVLPYVRSFSDRDGAVIFDIRNGKYYSFNGVAGQIWSALQSGRTLEEIADEISTEFSVPRDRVEGDIQRFIGQAREKRLVWNERTAQESPRGGILAGIGDVFVSLAALPVLIGFDVVMHVMNFRALHGIVKSFPVLFHRSPDIRRARRICASVNRASTFYFKRAWCLQRSATAVCFLRIAGYPAQLVIGAQKTPFYAHAWAGLLGEMVNDHENHKHDNFVVLDRC
jgi:hypothetical protein